MALSMTCAQYITFPNFVSARDIIFYNQVSFQDDVAYYSFPFKFELFYKNESLDEEERGKILLFKPPSNPWAVAQSPYVPYVPAGQKNPGISIP